MLNTDKKRKMQAVIALAAVAFVLCAAAIAGGAAYAKSGKARYKDERVESVSISSYEELAKIAEEISLNDNYSLCADIIIPADASLTIGSEARPFNGTFDGCGYSIIYRGDFAVRAPLFGAVSEKGTVKSLTVTGKRDLTDGNASAGLAYRNYGTIADCLINDYSVRVSGQGIVGGVVAYNYGSVKRCVAVADCVKSEDYVTLQKVTFGGVAGVNYGSIESVIGDVKLSNFAELDVADNVMGVVSNTSIGGVSGRNQGEIARAAVTLYRATGVYLCDMRESYTVCSQSREGVYNHDTVFNSLKFADDVWSLDLGMSLRGRA